MRSSVCWIWDRPSPISRIQLTYFSNLSNMLSLRIERLEELNYLKIQNKQSLKENTNIFKLIRSE